MTPSSSEVSMHEWKTLVQETVDRSEQEEVLLTDLLDAAGEYDIGREEARKHLFSSCSDPTIQGGWSEWEQIKDREELRLRLECLQHAADLHSSLHEFLIFFFRASDPLLYQAAALAMGAHLEEHPPLKRYFTSFAHRRDISLAQPIELNGERSRRRVLLGLTGHAAAQRSGSEEWGCPIEFEAPDRYLRKDAADLSTCLVALQALLAAEQTSPELAAFSRDILSGVVDRADFEVSRVLIHNWGQVLVQLSSVPDRWRANLWALFVRRLLSVFDEDTRQGIGFFVQLLHRTDEVIRTGALLPPELRNTLIEFVTARMQGEARLFVLVRLHVWLDREAGVSASAPLESLSSADEKVGQILRRIIDVETAAAGESRARLSEGTGESQRGALFAEWLSLVHDPKAWIVQPVEKRALITFFLLDFSLYFRTDREEIERLFETFGTRNGERIHDSSSFEPVGGAGQVTTATLRLLTQLLSVESSGAELLIDPGWIYQASDPLFLLKLLPSGQRSERLVPLADSFEHHLRFQMASDADFSPEHFLYAIVVQKPHPAFYDELIRRCRDRVYETEEGRVVPVREIILTFAREAETVRRGDGKVPKWLEDTSTITGVDLLPGNTVFAGELSRVRKNLVSLLEEEDPFTALDQMTDILNPKTKDPRWGSKGLTDFIGRVNVQNQSVLESGGPGLRGQSYERFAAAMQEHAVRLEEEILDLVPDTLQDISTARDAALVIRRILSDVSTAVIRVTGVVEALLLDRAIAVLRNRVVDWAATLENLHNIWIREDDRSVNREDIWGRLAEEISTLEISGVRHQAFSLYYRSLLAYSRGDLEGFHREARAFPEEREEWVRKYCVLQWGMTLLQGDSQLPPEDRELWTGFMVESWNRLMEEAMNEGYESRVVRLIDAAHYRPILKRSESSSTLDDAQTWLFDRYRARPVISIERHMDRTSGLWASMRTYGAFVLHFSHVWLALLIGAVLLLDFGDAWTAMAAAGDVTGIVLTALVGVGGTFLYLLADLVKKTRHAPEDNIWMRRLSRTIRATLFLILCLVFAFGVTTLLWFLLSGTDVVVHGEYAVYHVVVWTGFALFVGVFFGLLAQAT